MDRRQFIKLAGLGAGVVFASGIRGNPLGITSAFTDPANSEFYFVQMSDTHWGFEGAAVNPEARNTLKRSVEAVNRLETQPDFVVFTGDLTHITEDAKLRRQRMTEFRDIVAPLKTKTVHFMAGEHDASLDRGDTYQQQFGRLHYSFDHKGIHFVVLDNVSDPAAKVGETQLAWLTEDLKPLKKTQPIVVFTHRPLFDLYPQWDWTTKDAASVLDLLMPFKYVTVFYGHIHQEHHFKTGHIEHHAAKSLMFPLPAPGSVPKRAPLPWDPAAPYRGLGFREVEGSKRSSDYEIEEHALS
jgi:hypothetical protein